MAVTFNEEQQKFFEEKLKERLEQQKRQFEGYLSPQDLADHDAELKKQITDQAAVIDELKGKNQQLTTGMQELERKNKAYETRALKSRIAHESGLTYDSIDFLNGDDEESIQKSAESLKKLMGGSAGIPPVSREPKIKPDDVNEAYKNLVKGLGNEN